MLNVPPDDSPTSAHNEGSNIWKPSKQLLPLEMLIKSPHSSVLVFPPVSPSLSCAPTSALEYFYNLFSSALHEVVAVDIVQHWCQMLIF